MRIVLFFLTLLSASLGAMQNGPIFMGGEEYDILFENRLLAQVNGKPVTVYDVMKKMDLIFYRQYPEYISSKQARFQFYEASWRHVLKELIEKELMMADAEESKVEVTASEVRQELEKSFGPNIIANLDKIDMSLSEAKDILQSEIMIRKLMVYKVTGKAYRSISPLDLKEAYAAWTKENTEPENVRYRVLTIKDSQDGEKGRSIATLVHRWLKDGKGDLDEAKEQFEKLGILASTTKISTSEPLQMARDDLLPEVKEILADLSEKGFSEPIAQKSRRDDSVSWKIYALESVIQATASSFKSVEPKLREKLMDERISKEGKEYIDYLKDHYSVHDSYLNQLSKEWNPFSLLQLK